jgi:hypothetical protein
MTDTVRVNVLTLPIIRILAVVDEFLPHLKTKSGRNVFETLSLHLKPSKRVHFFRPKIIVGVSLLAFMYTPCIGLARRTLLETVKKAVLTACIDGT